MKIIIFVILFLFNSILVYTQTCDCPSVLRTVTTLVEEDYSGYGIKLKGSESKYLALKERVYRGIENLDIVNCYNRVKKYFRFFNDPHLNVNFILNEKTRNELKKIFSQYSKKKNWEAITNAVFSENDQDSIRGVWANEDSSYVVVIERVSKNHYQGIIKKSDSVFWFPGQIKFELKLNRDKLTFFRRDHEPESATYTLTSNILYITRYGYWKKITPVTKNQSNNYTDSFFNFYLTKISDSTVLMRLPNFTLNSKKVIDSLVLQYAKIRDATPNLIIDVRDNPGGFSSSFSAILKYIYSGNYSHPSFSILASEGNIQLYKKFARDNNFKDSNSIFKLIQNLEKNKGRFYKISDSGNAKIDSVYLYPRKVALLVNKGTISAAEDLILKVRQSKKVVVLGENTRGALDYQNIIQARPVPDCSYFSINCPTGTSLDGPKIDNIGIAPDIMIGKKTDWVSFVVYYLENKVEKNK